MTIPIKAGTISKEDMIAPDIIPASSFGSPVWKLSTIPNKALKNVY